MHARTHEVDTYELTHSTTMFFHRLRVLAIFTMHVFLGFFCRAPCSSARNTDTTLAVSKHRHAQGNK